MKPTDFRFFTHGLTDSEAPWLIFLHGLLGSAANWRRITPSFEKDFRILTFDQRGHGQSIKPKTGYMVEDFAGDLLMLMDHLKIKKAILVGHSMGGRIALTFTHLYPERITKLVLEDIGPELTDAGGGGLVQLLTSVPVPFASKLKAKEYLLNDLGDSKLGNFFYANMKVDPKSGEMSWDFDLQTMLDIVEGGHKQNRWTEWKSLKIPTLVIRGGKSRDLPKAEFDEMLKIQPHAQGVEVDGAGHWVHSDKPKEFISALKSFIES